MKANLPVKGAQRSIEDIKLNLSGSGETRLQDLPAVDPLLQKSIDQIFPNLDESYSITVLDITPGRPLRYACRQEKKQYQPGSVGKLLVVAGLFHELQKIYPDSFEKRQDLVKEQVRQRREMGSI